MSRSRRKKPIFGYAGGDSEKDDKRRANHALRTATRISLTKDEDVLPLIREVSSVWSFAKDGKHWWRGAQAKDMRK